MRRLSVNSSIWRNLRKSNLLLFGRKVLAPDTPAGRRRGPHAVPLSRTAGCHRYRGDGALAC